MAAAVKPPYRSPAGTWERILKSVLEDPALSDRAHRLLMYLATKPPGWKIIKPQLVRDLARSAHWVEGAVADLRAAGFIVTEAERDKRGAIRRRTSTLRRDLVLAKPQVNTSMPHSLGQVKTSSRSSGVHSEDCTDSEDGSLLSLERSKEHARSSLRSAPAGRAVLPHDSGEEAVLFDELFPDEDEQAGSGSGL